MKKLTGDLNLLLIFCAFCHLAACKNESTKNTDYLSFPSKLSPSSPYDVDTALERKLLSEHQLPQAQRIFDILSWQLFISLNWPLDKRGNPMNHISDSGSR